MSNWFKNAKSLIKEAIYIEKDFRLGVLNQKWGNTALVVWIVTIIVGFSLKYIPLENTNPFRGFQFDFGNTAPIWITLTALFSYPICMAGLVICYKKGWIEKDDF